MKRHWIPLAAVALQAALLFSNLNLLPLWGDEIFTLRTVSRPLGEIPRIVAGDIHPPLYYLLLHLWPSHAAAGLRAFSCLWALAATVLLDLFWTARWRPWRRACALFLFALSPCLLLYGRMARSYSMQTALFLVAASLLWRWYKGRLGPVPAFLAVLALLYTHYVPGLALLAAFAIVALPRLGPRRLALFATAFAVAYAPWLWVLADALRRWGQAATFTSHYRFTGAAWSEQVLKLGFGAVSLSIGESFYPATILLVPVIAWLAWRGLRRTPLPLAAMLAIAGIAGYLGATRWVSYPFVGARLLWLLPFLVLAAVAGMGRSRVLPAILLAASLASVFCYFRQENYLNMAYHAPTREIARRIRSEATASDLILVDTFDADVDSLAFYTGGALPLHPMGRDSRILPSAPVIWIVRNPRDVSPGGINTQLENLACVGRDRQVAFYLPYNAWQRALLARTTPNPPTHWYQLTRCRLTPTSSR